MGTYYLSDVRAWFIDKAWCPNGSSLPQVALVSAAAWPERTHSATEWPVTAAAECYCFPCQFLVLESRDVAANIWLCFYKVASV